MIQRKKMSAWIITSDLHLTDNPLDEYRWSFFPWLTDKMAQIEGKRTLFILGDLTQNKDYHSAALVNRVANNLAMLTWTGVKIIMLRGNHDGLASDSAYFEFLSHVPDMRVIVRPEMRMIDLYKVVLLPHTRDTKDWALIELTEAKYVFMHHTFSGTKAESGTVLRGDDPTWLKSYKAKIYSGDIHVPQKVGPVEYVGAPYPIRFGDRFDGRVICIQHGMETKDWSFPTIRKIKASVAHSSALSGQGIRKGDQLKVELVLSVEEKHEWFSRKKMVEEWCERNGVILCGVELRAGSRLKLKGRAGTEAMTPEVAMQKYIQSTKMSFQTVVVGKNILRGVLPDVAGTRRLRLKQKHVG